MDVVVASEEPSSISCEEEESARRAELERPTTDSTQDEEGEEEGEETATEEESSQDATQEEETEDDNFDAYMDEVFGTFPYTN